MQHWAQIGQFKHREQYLLKESLVQVLLTPVNAVENVMKFFALIIRAPECRLRPMVFGCFMHGLGLLYQEGCICLTILVYVTFN